jgi:hypothetical protein
MADGTKPMTGREFKIAEANNTTIEQSNYSAIQQFD